MSKVKSFLIGTALGASTMFFSLQYHIVHSQDGLRVLPRTPQQSLGLTYADIRGWNANQWTDRPELARALMAHGSSDLISESVSSTLKDRITDDSSTLDELRSFLNQIPAASADGKDSAASDTDKRGMDKPADDPVRIPFPQDARTAGPADPFRVATTDERTATQPAGQPSRFSADEVRQGLTTQPGSRTAAEARAMEERLFGPDRPAAGAPQTGAQPKSQPAAEDDGAAPFDDVTSRLESRAQEALNRAKSTVVSKTASTVEAAKSTTGGFVRSRLADPVIPANGAGTTATTSAADTAADAAPQLEFDPFLE